MYPALIFPPPYFFIKGLWKWIRLWNQRQGKGEEEEEERQRRNNGGGGIKKEDGGGIVKEDGELPTKFQPSPLFSLSVTPNQRMAGDEAAAAKAEDQGAEAIEANGSRGPQRKR